MDETIKNTETSSSKTAINGTDGVTGVFLLLIVSSNEDINPIMLFYFTLDKTKVRYKLLSVFNVEFIDIVNTSNRYLR